MRTELPYPFFMTPVLPEITKLAVLSLKGIRRFTFSIFTQPAFQPVHAKLKILIGFCNGADGINSNSTYSVCSIDVHLLSGNPVRQDIFRISP